MTRKPLTASAMLHQLVRCNDLWPKFDASDDQFERMAHEYKAALDDIDAEAVEGGVSIWIRTCTTNRWPSPAQIREGAMRWIQANRAAPLARKHPGAACQVCGAVPRWAVLKAIDWRTMREGTIVRQIHPCDESKHPDNHSGFVPYPPNFVRWAPEDETTTPALSLTNEHLRRLLVGRNPQARDARVPAPAPEANATPPGEGVELPPHRGEVRD